MFCYGNEHTHTQIGADLTAPKSDAATKQTQSAKQKVREK